MKTIYQCEICEFQSAKKDEVKKCERRGRKNKFSIKEKVRASVPGIGGSVTVKATVRKICFKKKTHRVNYDLGRPSGGIRDSSGKEIAQMFYDIPESSLSPIKRG